MTTINQVAVNAIRLAALTQLGPLAGGLFLSGSALAANFFAATGLAKAGAAVFTELTGGAAAGFFESALQGFSREHNHDLEKSLHQAAKQALQQLRTEISGFDDWFDSWHNYLTRTPSNQLFTATSDSYQAYDDGEFRSLWWSRMEPLLLRWHAAEDTTHTQLHLAIREQLPEPLRAFLKAQLPQAIETAHDLIERAPEFSRGRIATQQNFEREVLNFVRHSTPPKATGKVWAIPSPTRNFQDRPELIAKINDALSQNRTAALTALHGMGGIGKSQLARRFAEQRQDQYAIGAWLEAESDASLYAAIGTLGRQLGLHLSLQPRDHPR